jgi:hypothetical protein
MNHAAASTVNVVTEGLLLDHGETETKPMPAPSATNAKKNAAATNAPAKTAAHDTPETVSIAVSTAVTVDKGARDESVACVISFNLHSQDEVAKPAVSGRGRVSNFRRLLVNSVVEQRDQDDDRDRNAEKPKQNSTAQSTLLMLRWLNS